MPGREQRIIPQRDADRTIAVRSDLVGSKNLRAFRGGEFLPATLDRYASRHGFNCAGRLFIGGQYCASMKCAYQQQDCFQQVLVFHHNLLWLNYTFNDVLA